MSSTKFLAAATVALSLITPSFALYNSESKANLAMYWGAGSNQQSLVSFCEESTLDIIPLAFINKFPPQANGWVEMNFGNHACYPTVYDTNPGYGEDGNGNPIITEGNNLLSNACPELQRDIPLCQAMGKKIVISLGGAWDAANNDYFISGERDAVQLANFLWDAFGPYKEGYTGVRPLDRGYSNTSDTHIDIDGFDFDIEYIPQGMPDIGNSYYFAVEELRRLMDLEASRKKYLITGAPMCSIAPFNFIENPSPTMEAAIMSSSFDALFIQFYNDNCAANGTGFNIQTWVDQLANTASANAKLYIGLPASKGSVGSPQYSGNYLEPLEAKALVKKYQNTIPNFGGVMLWEATGALNNVVTAKEVPGIPCNTTYYQFIKKYALEGLPLPTVTGTACVSSTVSSTSSSTVTSSTISSTTSTTASTTSTSSASSTTTSTSSTTSSSSTSSTVSSTTSSSTSTTDSSTSSTSSSATETTSSSTSSSATETTSSSTSSSATETISSSTTTGSTTDVPTSTPSTSSTISSTSAPYGNSTTTQSTSSTTLSVSSSSAPYGNSTTTKGTLSTSSTLPTSTPGGVTSTSSTLPTLSGTTTSTSGGTTSTPGTLPTLSGTPTSTPGGVTSSSGTIPTGTPSSGPSGGVTSSSTSSKIQYTTSTVRATSVITVTSCAPEVTNCPNGPHVTTIIVDVSTTICPVTETKVPHPGTVPVSHPTISDKVPHPTGVYTPTGPGAHVPAPSSGPEKPSTEKPSTEKPSTEKPSTEKPSTEKPSSEKPSTEKPSSEKPSTEKPSTEKPSTEKPSPENPSPETPASSIPSAPVPTFTPSGSNLVHIGVPGGDEDSNSSIEETTTRTKHFTATQFTTLIHNGATKTIGPIPTSYVTVIPVPYPTPGSSKPAGTAVGSGVVAPSYVTYSTLPTSVSGGEATSTPVAPIETPLSFESASSKIGSGSFTTLMALVLAVAVVMMG